VRQSTRKTIDRMATNWCGIPLKVPRQRHRVGGVQQYNKSFENLKRSELVRAVDVFKIDQQDEVNNAELDI